MIHNWTKSTKQSVSDNNLINKVVFRVRQPLQKTKLKSNQIGDYEIHQTLGEGSFGVVKKAVHLLTGQIVAVKICSVQNWSENKLLLLERQISRQRYILHQNIAQIYQVIKESSKVYIFMEYCKNGQLFDKLSENGALPQIEAARIFHQILSALLYLRRNNLSHRDIKPQNILFDQDWNVKLVDFGYICYSNEDCFRTTVCGTSTYMAPQIIRRLPYNAELADVWSLGVTLYAMLTGELPFVGNDLQKRMRNIVNLKYIPNPSLSFRAHKLIKSIFRQQSQRIRLQEILQSEFCLACEAPFSSCIDFRSENINLQPEILQTLQYQGIDIAKLTQSVMGCKLDKYRALYFLTLRKQKKRNNCKRLSAFKKHRKYEKSDLSSILIRKLHQSNQNDISYQQPLPSRNSAFKHMLRLKQMKLHTEMLQDDELTQRRNIFNSSRKINKL